MEYHLMDDITVSTGLIRPVGEQVSRFSRVLWFDLNLYVTDFVPMALVQPRVTVPNDVLINSVCVCVRVFTG